MLTDSITTQQENTLSTATDIALQLTNNDTMRTHKVTAAADTGIAIALDTANCGTSMVTEGTAKVASPMPLMQTSTVDATIPNETMPTYRAIAAAYTATTDNAIITKGNADPVRSKPTTPTKVTTPNNAVQTEGCATALTAPIICAVDNAGNIRSVDADTV